MLSNALGDFRIATVRLAGYRPPKRELRITIADDNVGRVDVTSAGNVTVVSPAGGSADGRKFISLDGISFRAAP